MEFGKEAEGRFECMAEAARDVSGSGNNGPPGFLLEFGGANPAHCRRKRSPPYLDQQRVAVDD